MKIDKFNEVNKHWEFSNEIYPFKCKYKNRTPDPGICYVVEINFELEQIECSNGRSRYYPSFDEIEFIPDIFMFGKYNL